MFFTSSILRSFFFGNVVKPTPQEGIKPFYLQTVRPNYTNLTDTHAFNPRVHVFTFLLFQRLYPKSIRLISCHFSYLPLLKFTCKWKTQTAIVFESISLTPVTCISDWYLYWQMLCYCPGIRGIQGQPGFWPCQQSSEKCELNKLKHQLHLHMLRKF